MFAFNRLLTWLCMALLLAACGGGGGGSSGPARPVAEAGPDQTVEMGSTVTLDGSQSSSPRAEATLTYAWTLAHKPLGSEAELSSETDTAPTFLADLPGTYEASLTVHDGTAGSGLDRVRITVTNPDPVAIAAREHHVLIGTTVLLDGSASLPPTGGDPLALEYVWHLLEKPLGSDAALAGTGTGMTSFYADEAGDYRVSLVVNYQGIASEPLEIVVTAGLANSKPVALAGGPYTVERGQTLTLDGSGSYDADNDTLSYRWYLFSPSASSGLASIWMPNGSALTIETALREYDTATPTLTPDVVGSWTVFLAVYDGTSLSEMSQASITVTRPQDAPNLPPVASFFGTPRVGFVPPVHANEAELGVAVWSSGNSYDPDGGFIGSSNRRYQWISTPAGFQQDDLTGMGSFSFAPTVEGSYTVEMIVNDGELDSDPVRRTFIGRTGANRAPTASIKVDAQTIMTGATGWFDGRESSDPDGDPLTYHWHVLDRPDGSLATLQYANVTREDGAVLRNARAGLVADKPGVYLVALVVSDSHGVTNNMLSVQYGRVIAKASNTAPVIGRISNNNDHLPHRRRNTHFNDIDQPYLLGPTAEPLEIYAQNAVDPDLDELYFLWTLEQPAGSELADAGVQQTFQPGTPSVAGHYAATVIASDGIDTSEPLSLSFNAVQRAQYPSLLLEDHYSATLNFWDRNIRNISEEDSFPRQRAFPYWHHDDVSFPTMMYMLDEGDNVVKRYRLTAYGGDYTVTNLRIGTPLRTGAEVFSGRFEGLSEGQVIRQGESVEFSLMLIAPEDARGYVDDGNIGENPVNPYDSNVLVGLNFTFDVQEKPGWTFDYAPAAY